jgi:hypothetical protein
VRKADNLPPSCADVKKSGDLNLLEPCGPVQACNGTALRFLPESTKKTSKCFVSSNFRVPRFYSEDETNRDDMAGKNNLRKMERRLNRR